MSSQVPPISRKPPVETVSSTIEEDASTQKIGSRLLGGHQFADKSSAGFSIKKKENTIDNKDGYDDNSENQSEESKNDDVVVENEEEEIQAEDDEDESVELSEADKSKDSEANQEEVDKSKSIERKEMEREAKVKDKEEDYGTMNVLGWSFKLSAGSVSKSTTTKNTKEVKYRKDVVDEDKEKRKSSIKSQKKDSEYVEREMLDDSKDDHNDDDDDDDEKDNEIEDKLKVSSLTSKKLEKVRYADKDKVISIEYTDRATKPTKTESDENKDMKKVKSAKVIKIKTEQEKKLKKSGSIEPAKYKSDEDKKTKKAETVKLTKIEPGSSKSSLKSEEKRKPPSKTETPEATTKSKDEVEKSVKRKVKRAVPQTSSYAELCKKNAWTNLLYIQNFSSLEEMCATHTHQLTLDILKQLYRAGNLSYILSLHRAIPYACGVGLGVLLHHIGKTVKIHKAFMILGWLIAMSFGTWSLFSPWRSAKRDYVYDVEEVTHYTVISPVSNQKEEETRRNRRSLSRTKEIKKSMSIEIEDDYIRRRNEEAYSSQYRRSESKERSSAREHNDYRSWEFINKERSMSIGPDSMRFLTESEEYVPEKNPYSEKRDSSIRGDKDVVSFNFVLMKDNKRKSVQDLTKLDDSDLTESGLSLVKEKDIEILPKGSLGLYKRESIIKRQANEEDSEYYLPERPKLVQSTDTEDNQQSSKSEIESDIDSTSVRQSSNTDVDESGPCSISETDSDTSRFVWPTEDE
ncbi:uncharacterized protein V1478_018186 [Vespula squamosa]|uniref:Uncharacterized protein n=1 Tax=Vespula squamosa TaxID=30214 RepID=A0ABD1ZUN9_VESSQ